MIHYPFNILWGLFAGIKVFLRLSYFFEYLIDFTSEIIYVWSSLSGKVLITNSISLIDTRIRFCFLCQFW